MSLSAVSSVGDAIDLTREFMTPFSPGRILKLSVVVFVLSGGGISLSANVPPVPPTLDPTYSGPTADEVTMEELFAEAGVADTGLGAIPEELLLALLIAAAVLGLIAIVFAAIASIAEFVFVESLRSGDVTIRQYTSRRWKQGLSLLAFRIALGLLSTAFVALIAVLALELGIADSLIRALVYAGTAGALVVLTTTVISSLTTYFVVPAMIQEDRGILSGWKRVWEALRAQPVEFVVFVVVQYVLGLVLAAVVATVLVFSGGLIALALAVVFGTIIIVGGIGVTSGAGLALVIVAAVIGLTLLTVIGAVLQVPVQSYLRYYALLVLGDVDDRLDLVPDQRERARESQLGLGT
ncbi:DUF7544 domain-containing protein [Natranaeroarchaeum aerophilus]|uniref:Uncharacterized protein n=1 Tax=Natranaeroarchaeum aerophilus TaxID=2917711 RepID=A0AAE3FNE6_9EURY|nr:hypothetical protein [Natranaeroarchaeum aerophilus]MCL9812672.1 hypothetical protein [Natranaeroarchaeum aerophilus]